MSARVAVAVGAGVVALGGVGFLVWRGRGAGAPGDVVSASAPHGNGAGAVLLPTRVTGGPDFVAQMRAAMASELPQLNRNGRQLLVSHAAYESGFGTAKAFRAGWNFGNITAGKYWKGDSWNDPGGDKEFTPDGKIKTIDQRWRKYASLPDAVRDYWAFLGTSPYLAARRVIEGSNGLDSDPFAASLRAGGYFTLPLAAYQRGLAAVAAQVAQLWI